MPTGQAVCIPETLSDGGSSGFPGGYCSAACSTDPSVCSADGGALCIMLSRSYVCERVCSAPWAGQSSCRSGYVCYGYQLRYLDGGSTAATDGVCEPDCTLSNVCAVAAYCDAGYCVK